MPLIDLHRNTGAAQVLHFFSATAKDEGVTAFEPYHVLALTHLGFHQLFDERLGVLLQPPRLPT